MKAKYIFIAAALPMLSACNNDDYKFEPGAPDAPDCMGVYFDSDNEKDFIFVPGELASVEIKMHRTNTSVAADVPIIGKATSDGVTFPQSAHFDAGSVDATIVVDCSNLPIKISTRIIVDVPDSYINHYNTNLFNYETTALVSQWESANTDGSPVTFYFTDQDYNRYTSKPKVKSAVFMPVECEMEVLPGAGLLRIHNIINTGTDITLRLSESPYADFAGFYRVSPVDHYITMAESYESDAYGDEWYNAWFLLDDDDEFCGAELTTLEGDPVEFDWPSFFWYSDSYAFDYSYASLKNESRAFNSMSFGLTGVPSDNVTIPSYFYLFCIWDGESGM